MRLLLYILLLSPLLTVAQPTSTDSLNGQYSQELENLLRNYKWKRDCVPDTKSKDQIEKYLPKAINDTTLILTSSFLDIDYPDSCIYYVAVDYGITLFQSQHIKESELMNFQALKIAKEIGEDHLILDGYYRTAYSLYFQGDFKTALEYFEASYDYATLLEDEDYIPQIKTAMSICYSELGWYNEAIEESFNLAAHWEKVKDSIPLAITYHNLGSYYFLHTKDYDSAVKYTKKSAQIADKLRDSLPHLYLAEIYAATGRALYFDKEYEEAEQYYLEAETVRREYGLNQQLCKIYSYMSEMYEEDGNSQKEETYLNKGLEYCEKHAIGDDKYEFYSTYANYLQRQKRYGEALSYCKKIEDISENRTLRMDMACQKCFFSVYKAMGKPSKALSHYEVYATIEDSIINNDVRLKLETAQLKYDYEKEKLQDEIKIKELQVEKEKTSHLLLIRNFIALLSIMLGITIGSFFYSRYKLKEKFSSQIMKKNKLLEEYTQQVKKKNKSLKKQKKEIEQELKNKLLIISSGNRMLENLQKKIRESKLPPLAKKNMISQIENYTNEEIIEHVEQQYLQANQKFSKILTTYHPNLTAGNIKLCLLVKLGLSIKEIAQIQQKTPESVKVAKSRIKKKLNCDPDKPLYNYLQKLEDIAQEGYKELTEISEILEES